MDSTFVWFDLMTTDTAGARAFYESVVGYGVEVFEGGGKPYDMLVGARGPMGGLMELPPQARAAGAPTHWLGYVQVPDIDAATARVGELGGQIMASFPIPTVGRVTIFSDPQGAVLALFQPQDRSPAKEGRAQRGEMSWRELATADLEGSWSFYTALFGWKLTEEMDMGPGGPYRMYGAPGRAGSLGGFFVKPPEMPVTCWSYYINVEDLDGALDRVRSGGGRVLNGPMEVPGGDRVAQCMDPQGGAFSLHEFGG